MNQNTIDNDFDDYAKNIIMENEQFQNENWKNLKLYLEQFIKKNKISYGIFMKLVKNNDNIYIALHELGKLESTDNYLNFYKPQRTENKLFTLIEKFKTQYENDIEYKKHFDDQLSNVPIEQIYKTKINEIYVYLKKIGLEHVELINYSTNMLTLNVSVNNSVFDTSIYEYGVSKHPNIIAKNKLVVEKLIKEILKQFEIIDDNINIDIFKLSNYMCWR